MNIRHFLYTYLLSAIIASLASCSHSYEEQLANAETLIEENNTDSASTIIDGIKLYEISSDEEKALYGLLKTKVDVFKKNTIPSDTLIEQSLEYYIENEDKEKISDCLFYKSRYEFDNGKISDALNTMYNAERFASQTGNMTLKHKIYELLTAWNNDMSQFKVAEHYGELNLKISIASRNKNWLMYAYMYLACTYQNTQKEQLSKQYIDKALAYLRYVDSFDKANFYLTLGHYCDNDEVSEYYYRKALQMCPTPIVFSALCITEYAKGHRQASDSLLCEVNKQGCIELKDYTYSSLTSIAISHNDYQQVYKYIIPRDSVRELMHKHELDSNILNVYREHEYQLKRLEMWQKIMYAVYAISIAVGTVLFYFVIQRLIRNRKRSKALQNQLLINIYEEKLSRMKVDATDDSANQEKERLEKSLNVYRDNLSQIVGEGKQLYHDIMNGGNTLEWVGSDYENYIEYYKLIDLPFITQVESEYDNLTPRNIFYLILNKERKSDEEIMRIMTLTRGALRTMRSRIKGKKLTD